MDKLKIYSPNKGAIPNEVLRQRHFRLYSKKETTPFGSQIKFSIQTFTNIEANITFTPVGTTITVNPTRWLLDSNHTQINYSQLCEFVPQFIDYLQLNNDEFNITGLDFNQDIVTNFQPAAYLPMFDKLPRFNKTWFNSQTGINYITPKQSRVLKLYDKIAEMRIKGNVIPKEILNENRLRIEFGINKNFTNSKLKGIRTLNDLTNPNNYNLIVNEWYSVYNRIHKLSTTNKKQIQKPLNMKIEDFAILSLINQIGIEGYFSLIDIDFQRGMFSRMAAYNKKEKAKSIVSLYHESIDSETLIDELNEKVNQRYQSLLI